jgi:hypothetical protein
LHHLGAGLLLVAVAACGTSVPLSQREEAVGNGALHGPAVTSDPSRVSPIGAPSVVNGDGDPGLAMRPGESGGSLPGGSALAPSGGARLSKKPISVGFLAYDVAKLLSTVGGQAAGDAQGPAKAIISALNKQGGLAGRKIEPVYYTVDGTATDYSSQYQAACATFTQDHHVEAVIGVGNATFYSCLLRAGVPVLSAAGIEALDETAWRSLPNLFAVDLLAIDRGARAALEQSLRTRWLTKQNKLGVIVSGCVWGTRTYRDVVVPMARRAGVSVISHSLGCPVDGAGSLGPTSSEVQSAVLQFRAAGVDRVMFVAANLDPSAYMFFTKNADSQGWYPGYIVGSSAGASYWASQGIVSPEQLESTRVVGFSPFLDVTTPAQSAPFRACLSLLRSAGAPTATAGLGAFAYASICDAAFVLRAALVSNGGVGGLAALRPALEGLGASYVAAGTIDGRVRLGPDRHDGVRQVQVSTYGSGCSCFRYVGSPQPVP